MLDPNLAQQMNFQNEMQNNELDATMGVNMPEMVERASQGQAMLVEQTNPKKIVKEIILRLQGKEIDWQGNVNQVAEPKMNKIGIDHVWFILDSFINDNLRLSHYKEREIEKMMMGLSKDLVNDLSLNWKYYGIKKKTDLDFINNSILLNIYGCFKRGQEQNEKNWIGRMIFESVRPNSTQPKKDGFLDKFKL